MPLTLPGKGCGALLREMSQWGWGVGAKAIELSDALLVQARPYVESSVEKHL
ncbi:hypothetical protein [Austwickia chelonae]|uniref:hypothetical protein n=1 Tax=Austwickia chelonae TaxID=100225 RepID=UPI0013C2CA45|nr:hypothetical protein [Austwickia chelonae]